MADKTYQMSLCTWKADKIYPNWCSTEQIVHSGISTQYKFLLQQQEKKLIKFKSADLIHFEVIVPWDKYCRYSEKQMDPPFQGDIYIYILRYNVQQRFGLQINCTKLSRSKD